MKWLLAIILISGLALAGSDGSWFPVANLIGLLLVVVFNVLVVRKYNAVKG